MASPTEPPTWRKKVRLEVAVPRNLNGTAFCTTMVKTERVGPMPSPARNIQPRSTHGSVSALMLVKRSDPTVTSTMAPRISDL